MSRRAVPDSQSGQVVLMGVFALFLLAVSVGAGLYTIGPKSTLIQQKAAVASSTEVVKKAILTFIARNYRLPCPANGALAQGDANDGVETINAAGTACTIKTAAGVVPWKTLGLTDVDILDGWQHRIGYAVSSALVDLPDSTPNKLFYYTLGDTLHSSDAIQAETCTSSCGAASKYAYVLISFGSNGKGAYQLSGARVTAASGTNEAANALDTAFGGTSAFAVWPGDTNADAGAAYFDDSLTYETSAQLCSELNGSITTAALAGTTAGTSAGTHKPYCNPGNAAPGGPGSTGGSGSGGGSTSNLANTVGSQASYTGGSVTAASSANPQAFVGCGSSFCSNSSGKLTLINGLGTVTLTGGANGISTGNPNVGTYGDWIGGNDTGVCTSCPDPNLNPGYLVPGEVLSYAFNYSFTSFAFIDFLVNGGMTVQVTAYASQTPTDSSTWIQVGQLSLSNGNVTDPPCLGPGPSVQTTVSPAWHLSLYPSETDIPDPNSNNGFPPPEDAQQWPAVAFTDTIANYSGAFDSQFANRVFTDTDGSILQFNILSFELMPYVDSTAHTDSGPPYHFGMLFEGLNACPTLAAETITIGGTLHAGDTVALNITNSASFGGTVTIGPYTVLGTDTTTSIATQLVSLINANSSLRSIGYSATNYDTTTKNFGSTIQLVAESDVAVASNTVVAPVISGTETVALSSTTGKLSNSPGAHICDMRGLGVSPLYSDATHIPGDEWWNPPVNQTMDCSLQKALNLQ